MGSQFSSGQFRNVKDFVNLDLVRVKSLIFRFEKTVDRNFEEVTFMTKKQFQWTLKLSDRQTYVLFRRFDPDGFGRIPMIDVFGALALASSDNPGEKITFCFGLMDLDKDEHISAVDLTMLIRCCTRGFSRLKKIYYPPMKTINRLVEEAFELDTNTLNENGDISLSDLRAYILANDNSRTYLANLGTEIAIVDTDKLVGQRAEVAAKLAELENKLRILMMQQDSMKEDEDLYKAERGGMSQFVQLTADQLVQFNAEKNRHADDNFEDEMEAMRANRDNDAIDGVMTEAQRLRRLKRRAEAPEAAKEVNKVTDAAVFVTGCKPSQGKAVGHDHALEMSMGYKWDILEPQSTDKLLKVDVDLLEDLFEAGGITLTDAEAMMCIDSIPKNQLGRHRMHDILKWYANYRTNPPNLHPQLWLSMSQQIRERVDSAQKALHDLSLTMVRQYDTMKEVRRVLDRAHPKQITADGDAALLFSEARGSARMAAWQRQQQLGTPTVLSLSGSFGPPEDGGAETEPEIKEGEDEMVAKMKAARQKMEAEMNKWKGCFQFDYISKPEGSTSERRVMIDQQKKLAILLEEIECIDVMEYFTSKLGPNVDPDDTCKSGIWFVIDVGENASDGEARALLMATKNFFASIPHDFRHDLYDSVFGELVVVESSISSVGDDEEDVGGNTSDRDDDEEEEGEEEEEEEEEEDPNAPGNSPDAVDEGATNIDGDMNKENKPVGVDEAPSGQRRVVFIALTRKIDSLRKYEDLLPPGSLITRAVRHAQVKVETKKDLNTLYEESLPFENYEERLFGPQEDELGEDGMNPIRFAKLCKERLKACQDTIASVDKMNLDQMKNFLTVRGLYTGGTVADIKERVIRNLQRQCDIMGFGEMSSFGADICQRIFEKYDKDCDGAFSLWELNEWLLDLGTQTVIDQKDYQNLMEELELGTDENGLVGLDGITHYYERYGRLGEDMKSLGIGGLHDLMHGQFVSEIEFEGPALQSFMNLFDDHSAAFPFLKEMIGYFVVMKDCIYEGDYSGSGDIPYLKGYTWLQEVLHTPGWLAKMVHTLAEGIADGDEGIMRSVKNNALDHFGTYASFDSKFSQIFSAKPKSKSKPGNDDSDSKKKAKEDPTIDELLQDIFPVLENSEGAQAKIQEAMKRAERIRVYLSGNALLTRTEKEKAREELHQAELDTETNIKHLDTCINSSTAHLSAFYDAMRLFSSGIASIGGGTKESFFRVCLKGLDFSKFLPRALGEPSLLRFRREDRVNRAQERKKAALSAMERERARRNMTDAQREQQKRERQERAQAKRDEEEKTLFNESYIGLTQAREENKGESTLRKMIDSWKKLAMMRDQRYPGTIKSAVTSNNYAAVLMEFRHVDSSFEAEANKWCTSAVTCVRSALADFTGSFDIEMMKGSEASESFMAKNKRVVSYILIMQNFVTILRENTALSALRANMDIREAIWRLHFRLSKKELALLNNERKVEGMICLPYGDVKGEMATSVEEVKLHMEEMRLEDEAAARAAGVFNDKESTATETDDESQDVTEKTGAAALDPEYLALMARRERAKKEKERRKQREREKLLRNEAIRSRNKLYAMIKSDEITQFFSDRAENPALAEEELPWLKATEEELDGQMADGNGSVVSAITHPQLPGDASIDANSAEGYDYGFPPQAGGLHPSAASLESMSQISNVSDFGANKQSMLMDEVSMLGSITEENGMMPPGHDELTLGEDSTTSPKKNKGIFGWLFRSRAS